MSIRANGQERFYIENTILKELIGDWKNDFSLYHFWNIFLVSFRMAI
jgi:hypothetical protein